MRVWDTLEYFRDERDFSVRWVRIQFATIIVTTTGTTTATTTTTTAAAAAAAAAVIFEGIEGILWLSADLASSHPEPINVHLVRSIFASDYIQ